MSEEEEQQDSEIEFSHKDTFKDIVLNHLKKLLLLSCVEWRGGYYTSVSGKDGGEKEIYVQDSRELYSNGVHAFGILLLPKFDDQCATAYDNFQKELAQLKVYFLENVQVGQNIILGEAFYEKIEDKILLEEYRMKKLDLYIELFKELSQLIARHNYFEVGGGTF